MTKARSALAPARAATSFDTLRIWDGSQARAFEEISYQLLKQDAPAGTTAVRTGNPDGGVEWYVTFDDGREWGWQAKYVRGIENLLTAMEASLRRVVRDRPATVKLTFIVSWNLATSTQGGVRKSQRQKYADAVDRWKRTIAGAGSIDFCLIQESDLLARLAEPQHRGRRWFWWAQPVFTAGWLEDRLKEQELVAGDKYRPDLQVDLPIQEDIEALGFGSSQVAEFEHLKHRVTLAARRVRLGPSGPEELAEAHRRVLASAAELGKAARATVLLASSPENLLAALELAVQSFLGDADTAETIEIDIERRRRRSAEDSGSSTNDVASMPHRWGFRELRDAANALGAWLISPVGVALRRRLYFLTGPAGSGKTHLFLDSVRRALDQGRPAVVLSGGRFGRSDLWLSICDQLGLGPIGSEVLLGAMDSAGEASAIAGFRFVLLIDALNETTDPDFWRVHLPALRAAMARWPHVALAVSCRDTYVEMVDDSGERAHYQQRTHPGFGGREVEATQRYFEHYKLEAPRIPLLVPEFSVPLFLRMYCEGLAEVDGRSAMSEHEGRVRIFERYLKVKLDRVARRLQPGSNTGYELSAARDRVGAVLEVLLDEFAETGSEAVSKTRGHELATEAVGGSARDAEVVLGALEAEAVLSREPLYLEGRTQEGFRILFQAFADFLILRRRLAVVSNPQEDALFQRWLLDKASWGVLDAAAVVLPERFDVELPDLVGLSRRLAPSGPAQRVRRQMSKGRARRIYRAVVQTLPYRESAAVTDRTVDILNASLGDVSPGELYGVMFQIAPQPGNRLNAETLHHHLAGLPMPHRDASFGFATYGEIHEDSSPVATLARWASRGPYPTYDPKVVELAAIPLVWLLSSPNRYMRDWTTKALVQLLRGHLDVALKLLDRFWYIDDPYVVQRVIVITYGALMRWRGSDSENAGALVTRVRELVFTAPVQADELLLDAAHGVVEWAVAHGHLSDTALETCRRPYGLALPGVPPGEEELKQRYGYREGQEDDRSYAEIWFSVMDMGDFGRYVIEPGIGTFSRYRRDVSYPVRRPSSPPRLIKSRWAVFLASLTPRQRSEFGKVLDEPDPGLLGPWYPWVSGSRVALKQDQVRLLAASWSHPKQPRYRDDDYPSERARRWVLWRTIQLGWKPRLFGRADRYLGHGRGREAHKAERWGKKYQWMAYHELLAHVADNFHAARSVEDTESYEGLHQITGDREIDPSVPPLDYRMFSERTPGEGQEWGTSPVAIVDWPPGRLDFRRYQGDVAKFVADRSTEPTIGRMHRVQATAGVDWIMLDAYVSQGDPGESEAWRGLQQPLALNTLLVPRGKAKDLVCLLAEASRPDRREVIDTDGHIDCCYVGEVGRSTRRCGHFHRDFDLVEAGGSQWQAAQSVERVTWEAGLLDCSTDNAVRVVMPSSFIVLRSRLVLDERGPSWKEDGEVVLTNYGDPSDERSKALLARADWLSLFLRAHDLDLIVRQWHQRWAVHEHAVAGEPWEEVTTVGWLDRDLQLHVGESLRETR